MQGRALAPSRDSARDSAPTLAARPAPARLPIGSNQARLRGNALRIGRVDDPAEAQADRMADAVVRGHALSPPTARGGSNTVSRKGGGGHGDVHGGRAAPPSVAQTLAEPGRRLDAGTRDRMETGFGRDLSTLRIHDGAMAAQSSAEIGARAWSADGHIAFALGAYRPGTPEGERLLAHEIAHSVQGDGMVRREGSLAERAGKWYDEKKWAFYRWSIAQLKSGKNFLMTELVSLAMKRGGTMGAIALTLLGQVDVFLDMVIALLLAIVGLAVGFVEGLVGLVTGLLHLAYGLLILLRDMARAWLLNDREDYEDDCRMLAKTLENMIPAIKQAVDDWLKRYEHATLEEQVLMGGELVGQIEAFIATFALAGAKAGKAATLDLGSLGGFGKLQPAMAIARPAVLTIPAVVPQFGAEGVVLASQAVHMSSIKESGGSSAPAEAKAAPPQEAAVKPKPAETAAKTKRPRAPKVTPPPIEFKFIDRLKKLYPKLKDVNIQPKARPTGGRYFEPLDSSLEVGAQERSFPVASGAPEFSFEERMATGQGNYSLVVYDSKGVQLIEMDGISPEGWVQEVKIEQTEGKVEEIVTQLRRQAEFAEAHGLKGVEYSIAPPTVEDLVEAAVSNERLRNVYRLKL